MGTGNTEPVGVMILVEDRDPIFFRIRPSWGEMDPWWCDKIKPVGRGCCEFNPVMVQVWRGDEKVVEAHKDLCQYLFDDAGARIADELCKWLGAPIGKPKGSDFD